jgi:tRNA A-37 threonylcarbamoyl transferase component Bud32
MAPDRLKGLERFEILGTIGEGVSATVYKARDRTTDSIVAVKVLKPHLQTDPVSLERFRREVRITRGLQHPQIVSIYDLVRTDEVTCLVMEYIEGPNLKESIVQHAPLPIDTVLSVVTQTLQILAVCHAENVIHRDLKPQNIILTGDYVVHLLDFGIAKMVAVSDLTQTGTAIGTPEYMAPELFGRNTHDARTDLYALGIIAFELLAGVPPFRGESLAVLYQQHAAAPVPALTAVRADVPEWLQQLVQRLLAKQPYARYQSADEALADIEQQRVLARDVPSLRTVECIQCGEATLLDLPMCLQCGHRSGATEGAGDYDLLCPQDADDVTLEGFLDAVLAVRGPLRRRQRRLLLTGVDGFTAELLARSARRHDLQLTARPHSATTELRKALPLAFLALLVGGLALSIASSWAYYGRYYFESVDRLQLLPLGLALVLSWVCLRRFRGVEVDPVVTGKRWLAQRPTSAAAWLHDLLPYLTPVRTDAMKGCVAHVIEQYLKVSRFGHGLTDASDATLRQLVEASAKLACVLSEIERALGAPRFAEMAQRYAAFERDVPIADASSAPTRDLLAAELAAYYTAEEKYCGLANRLAQLQALLNRVVGRSVVLRTYMDDSLRAALSEHVRGLARDLEVSRMVHAELGRLA